MCGPQGGDLTDMLCALSSERIHSCRWISTRAPVRSLTSPSIFECTLAIVWSWTAFGVGAGIARWNPLTCPSLSVDNLNCASWCCTMNTRWVCPRAPAMPPARAPGPGPRSPGDPAHSVYPIILNSFPNSVQGQGWLTGQSIHRGGSFLWLFLQPSFLLLLLGKCLCS